MTSKVSPILERALAKGAGQKAGILWLLGGLLLLPMLYVGANMLKAGAAIDGSLRTGEKTLLVVLAALAITGAVLCVKAARSTGARGTRVGQVVLDDPERVFSVRAFQRDIRVNGVPVRKVHVVSIAIDRGDELELHLLPGDVGPVLEALKQVVGAHAMST